MGMAKETLSSLRQLCAREWRALVVLVLANVVYAFAVAYCTLPYRFPDIGVPGIAVLTNYLFGLSPNWMIVGVNLMLIYWGRRDLGLHFLALTVFSVAVFSGFLAVFSRFPFSITEDKFMAAVISGFLKGVSMGAMFNVGGSSGGFDIAAAVLRRRYDLEVGRFSIIYNVVILAFSLGVVGLESVVYGVVSVYICGVMLDNMTRNFDKRKQALIITNIPDEVSRFITATGRGVTRLDGRGVYTGEPRPVLLSLLGPRQVANLKRFLKEKDPHAFVSICDASEVLGQGFKNWRSL